MNRDDRWRTGGGRRCSEQRPSTRVARAVPTAATSQRKARRPVRRTPRSRRLLRLLVLVAVVCTLAWGGARVAIAQTEAAAPVTTHRVQPGETLWGIVEVYYDDDGRDIRRVIQDIMDANGLPDAILRPGQVIELPSAAE